MRVGLLVLPSLCIYSTEQKYSSKNKNSLSKDKLFFNASSRNRTSDTRIFSPLLYRLSYRGKYDAEGARTLDLQRDRLAF